MKIYSKKYIDDSFKDIIDRYNIGDEDVEKLVDISDNITERTFYVPDYESYDDDFIEYERDDRDYKSDYEKLAEDYEELKKKYRDRFFSKKEEAEREEEKEDEYEDYDDLSIEEVLYEEEEK